MYISSFVPWWYQVHSYKVKVVIIIYKTTDYSLANKKSKRIAEALHQAWNIIRQNLLY